MSLKISSMRFVLVVIVLALYPSGLGILRQGIHGDFHPPALNG